MECEVRVSLRSNTPVVGCELNPWVRVGAQSSLQPPHHTLNFTWYRELHKTSNDSGMALGKLGRCESWPVFGTFSSLDEGGSLVVEREGKTWIKLGSSRTYVPSLDDFGFSLRLESVATDGLMGMPLSPLNVIVTDPVITSPAPSPRRMISVETLRKSKNLSSEVESFHGGTFSVLSYNILADLYTSRDAYNYCPTWALTWEYRRQRLLNEIIGYNADILCLQEVQSDHFEDFFKPELEKCGYSVIYKKKTKEVYTANQYTIDGCATFFRRDQFKEIVKYELEFDKSAFSVVEALEPYQRSEGCFRLMKGNIALVVVLEAMENGSVHDAAKSRICVANTHIHADSSFPDTKLFQVVNFIMGLEKIAYSQIPLLICGDMNSLPGSDPHKFVLAGKIKPVHTKSMDPFGIYKRLKLCHSMRLASAYSSLLQSRRIEEQQKEKMDPATREPQFTNLRPGIPQTLDYIFYEEHNLKVDGLLELLDYESVGGLALPSPIWSSDHIALMASFRFKPGFWRQQYSSPPPNPWQEKAIGLRTLVEEDSENSE